MASKLTPKNTHKASPKLSPLSSPRPSVSSPKLFSSPPPKWPSFAGRSTPRERERVVTIDLDEPSSPRSPTKSKRPTTPQRPSSPTQRLPSLRRPTSPNRPTSPTNSIKFPKPTTPVSLRSSTSKLSPKISFRKKNNEPKTTEQTSEENDNIPFILGPPVMSNHSDISEIDISLRQRSLSAPPTNSSDAFEEEEFKNWRKKMKLKKKKKSYIFVCAGVGDCKAYAYLRREKKVRDFTAGTRANSNNDASDPGGRLGPYIDGGADLRNFDCSYIHVEEGDIIFLVSDGVHDNFDPETLGKTPDSCGLLGVETWSEVNRDEVHAAKVKFAEEFVKKLIEEVDTEEELDPLHVVSSVIKNALNTTQNSRNWLEASDQRLPNDYTRFPGKMDHTTCVCFRVGDSNSVEKVEAISTLPPFSSEEKEEKISQTV